jgi:hypothetical protein
VNNKNIMTGLLYVVLSSYFLIQYILVESVRNFVVPFWIAVVCFAYGIFNIISYRSSAIVNLPLKYVSWPLVLFGLAYVLVSYNTVLGIISVAVLSSILFNRPFDLRNFLIMIVTALSVALLYDLLVLKELL